MSVLWWNVWNKELLTLRNFFVATKKFLKAKFDCILKSWVSPPNEPNQQIKPHPIRWHYPLITYLRHSSVWIEKEMLTLAYHFGRNTLPLWTLTKALGLSPPESIPITVSPVFSPVELLNVPIEYKGPPLSPGAAS